MNDRAHWARAETIVALCAERRVGANPAVRKRSSAENALGCFCVLEIPCLANTPAGSDLEVPGIVAESAGVLVGARQTPKERFVALDADNGICVEEEAAWAVALARRGVQDEIL